MNRRERADHLFKVVTSERFLTKQGLGNEVPFFICPYPARDGLSMHEDRKDLIERISHAGVKILDIDLYDLSLEILREREILDQILEIEADSEKGEIKDLLQGVLDPEAHLIPRIGEAIAATDHDVIFLSGAGEVYPYLRVSHILENLQSTIKTAPMVVFFPGTYTAHLDGLTALHLFGCVPPQRYYRAFDLTHYEV